MNLLPTPPGRVRVVISVLALALATTYLWEVLLGGVPLGDFVVHPGELGYLAMVALALPVAWRGGSSRWVWAWAWAAATSLASADLFVLITREAELTSVAADLAAGSVLALLVGLGTVVSLGPAPPKPGTRHGLESFLVGGGTLATIGGFQVFNRTARAAGVPNEDRSLLIGGAEIHHLNWGILVVALIVPLLPRLRGPWKRGVGLLGLGFGAGLIVDEWLYYALRSVTDDAYFEPVTWASATALALMLPGLWWTLRPTPKSEGRPAPSRSSS